MITLKDVENASSGSEVSTLYNTFEKAERKREYLSLRLPNFKFNVVKLPIQRRWVVTKE